MYVYLLASGKHGTLYLGVTNDLVRRVYECHDDAYTAISREKELKKWRRNWKIRLIEEDNPDWSDLYASITR
jgi:putative endonuclease